MKKTLKEKAAIFRTKAVMLKEQNVRLQNGMSNVSEQNKSLELEVEKLKSALVVKDLQKDLDHSEEKQISYTDVPALPNLLNLTLLELNNNSIGNRGVSALALRGLAHAARVVHDPVHTILEQRREVLLPRRRHVQHNAAAREQLLRPVPVRPPLL